jgi:hypothetical protein
MGQLFTITWGSTPLPVGQHPRLVGQVCNEATFMSRFKPQASEFYEEGHLHVNYFISPGQHQRSCPIGFDFEIQHRWYWPIVYDFWDNTEVWLIKLDFEIQHQRYWPIGSDYMLRRIISNVGERIYIHDRRVRIDARAASANMRTAPHIQHRRPSVWTDRAQNRYAYSLGLCGGVIGGRWR